MTEGGTPLPPSTVPRAFQGLVRLYGVDGWAQVAAAHVCVVGLGGVGSWAVEALARCGIGRLTLIDPDEVCLSNINRQLAALHSTVGQSKAAILRDRVADLAPDCRVEIHEEFLLPSNVERLLTPQFDYVLDAVDRMSVKAAMIDFIKGRGGRILSIGGAGGRTDPGMIRSADLGVTGRDDLLRQVRKKLRRSHGWAKGEGNDYGVPCVFSIEPQIYPTPEGGISCQPGTEELLRLDCAEGYGSAVFVTGAFAFQAVARIIGDLAGSPLRTR